MREINALNVIHIAGTKGKGSTCAFIDSFLRAHGRRTGFPAKTGLYTSPHLIDPEERIRLNMRPIDRHLLAKYFFEVYDRLPQLHSDYDPSKPLLERGPRYLQLWALLAFHVFIREGVAAAIIETHNGGEYDATNIVDKPAVTAVAALGMDHLAQLGPTIENIAWHKAGIFKPGASALSTAQKSSLAEVLRRRAEEKGEAVRFIGIDPRLPSQAVQPEPQIQRNNASLALAAADAFLHRTVARELQGPDIDAGVAEWSWPGRFQIWHEARTTWFLDAAHNDMSVELAAAWFADAGRKLRPSQTEPGPLRVLLFAHVNELRDAEQLLQTLALSLARQKDVPVDHAVFTTYGEGSKPTRGTSEGVMPSSAAEIWRRCHPSSQTWDAPAIPEAVERVRSLTASAAASVQVLVTGSQHLVGPVLRILKEG